MPNKKMVNLKMTRKDVCELMLACTNAFCNARISTTDKGEKWWRLHQLLDEQLEAFDEKERQKGE